MAHPSQTQALHARVASSSQRGGALRRHARGACVCICAGARSRSDHPSSSTAQTWHARCAGCFPKPQSCVPTAVLWPVLPRGGGAGRGWRQAAYIGNGEGWGRTACCTFHGLLHISRPMAVALLRTYVRSPACVRMRTAGSYEKAVLATWPRVHVCVRAGVAVASHLQRPAGAQSLRKHAPLAAHEGARTAAQQLRWCRAMAPPPAWAFHAYGRARPGIQQRPFDCGQAPPGLLLWRP